MTSPQPRRQRPSAPSQQDVPPLALIAGADADNVGPRHRSPARWGIWILFVAVAGFLTWALFAPIDEGVPATGTVVVDTKRQSVQHVNGGIVRELLVREAQPVKAGQLLIRLDESVVRSAFDSARQQYLSLIALESRLQAEQRGSVEVRFHPDLHKDNDGIASGYMSLQRQLVASRRAALEGELSILRQTAASLRDQLPGLQAQLAAREEQLKLVRTQLVGTRGLAEEGYLPRNKLLEEERLAAELTGTVGDLKASLARTRSEITATEMRIGQRQREFLRDAELQLADASRDARVALERLNTAREELARMELRAPVDGVIVGLAIHTVGGVIAPGAKLMDIVPSGVPLTLEVRVEPHLVDRISTGMPADVRIHAFLDNPNLVLEGRVISLSADLISDQANVPPYYLARVVLTAEGLKDLGRRQLQPGMPAEVVIKTGERSLANYLLKPLIQRLSTSFREV